MSKIIGVHSGGTVGKVITYPAASVPAFAIPCDGRAINRITYAALFARIGIAHGSGDGSTTFNVPDYRGRFLRMVDGTAGNDPDSGSRTAMASGGATGNNVGSVQADQFHSHIHTFGSSNFAGTVGNATARADGSGAINQTDQYFPGPGGNETRPKNANTNYAIVWK